MFLSLHPHTEVSTFDAACGTFGIGNYSSTSSGNGGASLFCPHDDFLCAPKNDLWGFRRLSFVLFCLFDDARAALYYPVITVIK